MPNSTVKMPVGSVAFHECPLAWYAEIREWDWATHQVPASPLSLPCTMPWIVCRILTVLGGHPYACLMWYLSCFCVCVWSLMYLRSAPCCKHDKFWHASTIMSKQCWRLKKTLAAHICVSARRSYVATFLQARSIALQPLCLPPWLLVIVECCFLLWKILLVQTCEDIHHGEFQQCHEPAGNSSGTKSTQGRSTRPLCKVTFSQSRPTTIRPDLNNFSTWLCRSPRPLYYGPCCMFWWPAGFCPQASNQNLFTSHFDWLGIHPPESDQDHSSHLSIFIIQRSQDLPNLQDILGCSAYQVTKIWIAQSNLGPNFSFSLTSSLAHNIFICTIFKPKCLTT